MTHVAEEVREGHQVAEPARRERAWWLRQSLRFPEHGHAHLVEERLAAVVQHQAEHEHVRAQVDVGEDVVGGPLGPPDRAVGHVVDQHAEAVLAVRSQPELRTPSALGAHRRAQAHALPAQLVGRDRLDEVPEALRPPRSRVLEERAVLPRARALARHARRETLPAAHLGQGPAREPLLLEAAVDELPG